MTPHGPPPPKHQPLELTPLLVQGGHENAWFGIWDEALDHTKYEDEHVVKTIRALSYADQHHHDVGLLKQETYINVAQMVLDNVKSSRDWDHSGHLGFDQVRKH